MNAMSAASKIASTVSHPFVQALVAGVRTLPASDTSWLNQRRAAALERANALSVPTTHDEEWRFTDLTPLNRLHVEMPSTAAVAVDVTPYKVPEAAARLVFVDGV